MARALFVSTLVMATATTAAGAAIALRGGTIDKDPAPGMVRGESPRRNALRVPLKHPAPVRRHCARGVCWTAERWALQSWRHYRKRIAVRKRLRTLQVARAGSRTHPPAASRAGGTVWDRTVAPYRDWLARLRDCESDGNYQAVSPGGTYSGAYQFDDATWASVGGTGRAGNASPAEQDYRAALLRQRRGTAPWPVCG